MLTIYCVRDKLAVVNESLKQSLLKLKGKNVSLSLLLYYFCIFTYLDKGTTI